MTQEAKVEKFDTIKNKKRNIVNVKREGKRDN